jgi:metalloprotein, YbeY family
MGKLVIESLQKKLKLRKLAKAVYTVLGQKAKIKAELVFESEDGIQILNKRERGVDSVTDVLSFPSLDGIKGVVLKPENCFTEMDGGYIFIGSIVLCEEKIKEQAAEIGHSEERETQYLIIHGLMHLFGYDHLTDEDKAEMREKEKEVIALLGEAED